MKHRRNKRFTKLLKNFSRSFQIFAREVFEDFRSHYPDDIDYLKQKYTYHKLKSTKKPTFSIYIPNKKGGRAVHQKDENGDLIWIFISESHDDYDKFIQSLL